MGKTGKDNDREDALQPGQQTDTGTGHGVKGQGGQETSRGVPDGRDKQTEPPDEVAPPPAGG